MEAPAAPPHADALAMRGPFMGADGPGTAGRYQGGPGAWARDARASCDRCCWGLPDLSVRAGLVRPLLVNVPLEGRGARGAPATTAPGCSARGVQGGGGGGGRWTGGRALTG